MGEGKDKTRDREPRTGKIRYQLSYQSVIFAVTQFSGWEARGQLRLRGGEGRGDSLYNALAGTQLNIQFGNGGQG